MITLCGFAVSNYYNKVKMALLEKNIPFTEETVMTKSKDEAVLSASPLAKITFIRTDKGALCESAVIMDYLEATGECGDYLSDQRQPGVSLSDLTRLFSEDGQIIELRLHVLFDGKVWYKFEIRDGAIFDLLGKGDKSFLEKIGVSYKEENPQLFGW